MKTSDRKPGFYWVRIRTGWEPALWARSGWGWITLGVAEHRNDDFFDEIGPRLDMHDTNRTPPPDLTSNANKTHIRVRVSNNFEETFEGVNLEISHTLSGDLRIEGWQEQDRSTDERFAGTTIFAKGAWLSARIFTLVEEPQNG